ncbi:LANO_0H04258g1_1 [Lachancea nothofagi CBS 11611]|uniref:LANO_0H04258g1_1 n=1 Tax=Lachancea nothofagi CBS 11611 TaxID=1266666 RepID=A0A1G4KL37_9SACH|nr:LANO_0H04258g1_1 [Lachancea nothofagi CBS 11611]
MYRRKKDHKRGISYSLMLVGDVGTGKTTFANNLLEMAIFPHKYAMEVPELAENPRVKVIKPTMVVSYNSKNGIPSHMAQFDAGREHFEPGVTITSTTMEISTGQEQPSSRSSVSSESSAMTHNGSMNSDKISLNLVKTHGLGENLDNSMCFDEITGYLEQQFDQVLGEETRIKRNPRFEDTRVHLALYFIPPTGHGLREMDVEMMKRLSRFTNVLPIISRADSFTREELIKFKRQIMDDIERFNVPVYKFEVDPEEDDLETVEENQALAMLQPFAVMCSDERNENGHFVRSYPWGEIKVDDDNVSDLRILKNVLFGSHFQEFKDTAQNFLYENYRAEKLSSVSEWDMDKNSEHIDNKRNSAAPSLSNFASLITTGQFKSSNSLAMPPQSETPTTPDSREISHGSGPESPALRQISQSIRRGNEEIINNIKNSPRSSAPGSPDKSKLRNISETVPYVLKHERIIARQQKLEELEAQSAKELQKRIQDLEKRAADLKLRERLLRQQHLNSSNASLTSKSSSTQHVLPVQSKLKKEESVTDLASIVSGRA